MPLISRIIKFVLGCILVLFLTASLLALAATVYLRNNPETVTRPLISAAAAAGYTLTVGRVEISFFPLPALALVDINLEGKNGRLAVPFSTVRPDIARLFHGEVAPGAVTLVRPEVFWTIAPSSPDSPAMADPPPLPSICRVNITEGRLTVKSGSASYAFINLAADLGLNNAELQTKISADALTVTTENHTTHAFGSVKLLARTTDPFHFSDVPGSLQISLHVPAMGNLSGSQLSLSVQQEASGQRIIDARLTGTGPAPWSLYAAGTWNGDSVTIDPCVLEIGDTGLVLKGNLDLTDMKEPVLDGHLTIKKLSLPRWFGFARNFPGGLQRSLDSITGHMDITITTAGLNARNILASAAGSTFTGTGGVPSWKNPVITLNVKAPAADLAAVLPESLGDFPEPPDYGHPPLIPDDTDSGSPASKTPAGRTPPPGSGVGYAIRLMADRLQYDKISAAGLTLDITPAGEDVVLLATTFKKLYGGSAKADLFLDTNKKETGYTITTEISGLHPLELGRALGVRERLPSGDLAATARITASGDTLDRFLHSLRGSFRISSQSGTLQLPGAQNSSGKGQNTNQKPGATTQSSAGQNSSGPAAESVFPYQEIRVILESRGMDFSGHQFHCTGNWDLQIRTAAMQISATADGPVSFKSESLLTSALPVQASVSGLTLPGFATPAELRITGKLTADTPARTYSMADVAATALDFSATGNAAFRYDDKAFRFSGTGTVETPNLRRSLASGGISLPRTAGNVYGKGSLSGEFCFSPEEFSLKDARARLDDSNISGSLTHRFPVKDGSAAWSGAVLIDTLNLNDYVSPPAAGAKSPSKSSWPTSLLQKNTVDFALRCTQLQVKKLTFRNVSLPVRIRGGELTARPVTATLYGGAFEASFGASPQGTALKTQISAAVRQADMLAATRDQELSSDIAGKAHLRFALSGLSPAPSAFLRSLSGVWNMEVVNGYQQKRNPNGTPAGKRSRFHSATASGSMQNGKIHSSDFLLRGPGLTITGNGSLDTASSQIDAHFLMKSTQFPDIPIDVSGTLSTPKTFIRADKVLINGIGHLGTGLFSIMGDIASGALKLLQP